MRFLGKIFDKAENRVIWEMQDIYSVLIE